jgi:hypothetical protein
MPSLKLNVSVTHARNDMPSLARSSSSVTFGLIRSSAPNAAAPDLFRSALNGLPTRLTRFERRILTPRERITVLCFLLKHAKTPTPPVTHKHNGNPAAQ